MSATPTAADTSVVVPNLDSPVVDRAVASVLRQTAGLPREILVVGSDLPGRVPLDPRVRLVPTPGPVLPGAARNLGAAVAAGSILAFLDADCEADEGWLGAHLARQAGGESVVGGAVLFDAGDRLWRLADNFSSFHPSGAGQRSGPRRYLPTLNLSVVSAVYESVGPMSPVMPRGEDLDWTIRAALAGHRPYFEPLAKVWHRPPGRTDARSVLRKWYDSGRWMVTVRRRYPESFGGYKWIYRPWLLRMLSPVIAAATTGRLLAPGGQGWRYPLALPAVYLTKLAWCWGAARPAPGSARGEL